MGGILFAFVMILIVLLGIAFLWPTKSGHVPLAQAIPPGGAGKSTDGLVIVIVIIIVFALMIFLFY